MQNYAASDDVLIYLIGQTVNGSNERRLAAKFILECPRTYDSGDQIAECIDELEDTSHFEVGSEARVLAEDLGLIN
jgi:hypothetical protein